MITKSSAQAIRILAYLSGFSQKRRAQARKIAQALQAPANYTAKILQILSARKLIVAHKGRGGGVYLSRKPERISLFEVVSAMEKIDRWNLCVSRGTTCKRGGYCSLHKDWERMRAVYIEFLKSKNIRALARNSGLKTSETIPFL
jgi:Rrf2 family protein